MTGPPNLPGEAARCQQLVSLGQAAASTSIATSSHDAWRESARHKGFPLFPITNPLVLSAMGVSASLILGKTCMFQCFLEKRYCAPSQGPAVATSGFKQALNREEILLTSS